MDYFADSGLFMMPTHTWGTVKVGGLYDYENTPGCVGILPEIFRKRPGVIRSLHPSHSIAAWGKDAENYVVGEEHSPAPCPPDGCWGRLRTSGAKILLLGVGHNRNTYIHSVEESLGMADRLSEPVPVKIKLRDGSVKEHMSRRHHCSKTNDVSASFPKMAEAFAYYGAARPVKFGDADCLLCDPVKLFEVSARIFSREPDAILDRESLPENFWKE
jgi:aminoglycoside 3-N-acetyltransferase